MFSLVNPEEKDNKIVIDEYDLNEIVSKWNLQWKRSPTPEELKGLLDNYIKEEIMYREALAMNLDHNDEIIRRRMAQKMEFLTQDIAQTMVPTDEELQTFLDEHQQNYMLDKKLSFNHIYFSPDKRTDPFADAMQAKKITLLEGDPSPVNTSFEDLPLFRVRAMLGEVFANAIDRLEASNVWQGPIQSGFGFHLVKVNKVVAAQVQPLEDVRLKLVGDFHYNFQKELNEELFKGLLLKYEVVIDLDDELLMEDSKK